MALVFSETGLGPRGKGDREHHLIGFLGIGQETTHLPEQSAGKRECGSSIAFAKRHKHPVNAFAFYFWAAVLEFDMDISPAFKSLHMKRITGVHFL